MQKAISDGTLENQKKTIKYKKVQINFNKYVNRGLQTSVL